MFIKNSSGDASIIKKFCKGEEFMWGGSKWKIIEAFISDNTEMRRMRSDSGDDEIITLTELLREIKVCPGFQKIESITQKNVKDTDTETEAE